MTFTPIETQEAFEAALKERLERERSTMTKKFEGYTSPEALQKIKDEYESNIDEIFAELLNEDDSEGVDEL